MRNRTWPDAREAEHHVLDDVQEAAERGRGGRGLLVGGLQVVARAQFGGDPALQRLVVDALLSRHRDAGRRVLGPEELLLSGRGVEEDEGGAGVRGGEGGDADDLDLEGAGAGEDGEGVADLHALRVGRVRVQERLARPARGVPGGEFHGAAVGDVPVGGDGRGAGRRPHRFVVAVDDGDVLDGGVDMGVRDPLDPGHLLPEVGGQGRRPARGHRLVEVFLRRDQHIGRRGGEQAVEGAGHRVREDQAARDERDREDDGEGGQGEPALVREEAPECRLQHRGPRFSSARTGGRWVPPRAGSRNASCVRVPRRPSGVPCRPRSVRRRERAPGRSGRRRRGRGSP